MAKGGMFRSAMRGFHKQDVLQYIDEITGAWDAERKDLEQQAATALAAEDRLKAAAQQAEEATQQALALAQQAQEKTQVAEAQLSEVQQQLYDATADLANSRSAAADLEAQLQEALKRVAELEAQLTDAQQANQQQREQIDTLQQSVTRYEKVLGNAETAQQHVDNIVRPFIEQANKQADETMDNVQAVLAGVLAQLGELQGNVDQRRQALHRCKTDSDSRLSAAFGDWLGEAKQATSTDHFFR